MRNFAIIPAAGHSRRMGTNKLLLPWHQATVIDQVLATWTKSLVTRVVIVVRQDDVDLITKSVNWPVEIVRPQFDPRDMKESIQCGLQHLSMTYAPEQFDRWLVAPADLPALSGKTIDTVISATLSNSDQNVDQSQSIVLPRYGDRRGHPVSFPWAFANAVFALPHDEGVNRLLLEHPVSFIDFPGELAADDIDTPEQYRRQLDS